jgi:hypothetical protein
MEEIVASAERMPSLMRAAFPPKPIVLVADRPSINERIAVPDADSALTDDLIKAIILSAPPIKFIAPATVLAKVPALLAKATKAWAAWAVRANINERPATPTWATPASAALPNMLAALKAIPITFIVPKAVLIADSTLFDIPTRLIVPNTNRIADSILDDTPARLTVPIADRIFESVLCEIPVIWNMLTTIRVAVRILDDIPIK